MKSSPSTPFLPIVLGLVFWFAWVKLTRVGPVVLVVSEKFGWGVHAGDIIGSMPLLAIFLKRMKR